jgi:hypothetical protein
VWGAIRRASSVSIHNTGDLFHIRRVTLKLGVLSFTVMSHSVTIVGVMAATHFMLCNNFALDAH